MPLEAPQVAEAQAVLALHVDRSADQGSGGLIVCADIHDGQILNHRGTMDTECSEQQFFPTSVFIVSLWLTFWGWHS
jgi:hypothetical protein